MGSRILFLGTAGDAVVMGKQHRRSGGIIFSYESIQFHINPGPGALVMAKMASLNLRENIAVIISRNDILSCNDVNAVISAMTVDGLDKRGVLLCPSSLLSESGSQDSFLNKKYRDFLEKIITLENTKKIAISQIEIDVIKQKHSFGFKFITPRFNLAFIPELLPSQELFEFLKSSDILILSMAEDGRSQENFKAVLNNAKKILEKSKPQLAILTGFTYTALRSEPLYIAREMQKSSGVQIIAAKDGMTINPVSFAATVRQKKLGSF